MSTADRRIFQIWAAVTTAAIIALLAPFLTAILVLTIIGIPLALLLGVMPGMWMYLTPTVAIYAMLRWRFPHSRKWLLLVLASVLPLIVGIAIPLIANQETDRRLSALLAQDRGSPPRLPAGTSVTYVGAPRVSDRCNDHCQRLLLTGTTASYIEVERNLFSRLGDLPSLAMRYSIGPRDGACQNTLLLPTFAGDQEVGRVERRPYLWDKLKDSDLCLHADRTRDARSEFIMVETLEHDPEEHRFRFRSRTSREQLIDLRAHPIAPFQRWEVYRRVNGRLKLLMRRTKVEHARHRVPLWLSPGFAFDTFIPAHWALENRRTSGEIEVHSGERWSLGSRTILASRDLVPKIRSPASTGSARTARAFSMAESPDDPGEASSGLA